MFELGSLIKLNHAPWVMMVVDIDFERDIITAATYWRGEYIEQTFIVFSDGHLQGWC